MGAILLSQHFRLSLLQIKSHLQISPTSSTFSSKLIKMAAILAGNNVEEEFMWSCTLTGSNKEYSWDPAVSETDAKEGEEQEGYPDANCQERRGHCDTDRIRGLQQGEGYRPFLCHEGWIRPPKVRGLAGPQRCQVEDHPRGRTDPFGWQPLRGLLRIQG